MLPIPRSEHTFIKSPSPHVLILVLRFRIGHASDVLPKQVSSCRILFPLDSFLRNSNPHYYTSPPLSPPSRIMVVMYDDVVSGCVCVLGYLICHPTTTTRSLLLAATLQ